MAFPIHGTLPFSFNNNILPPLGKKYSSQATCNFNTFSSKTQCKASYKDAKDHSQTITRRVANFQPSVWTYDHIQSLSSEYKVRFNTYLVSFLHIYLRVEYIFLVLKNYYASNFTLCY